MVCEVFELSYDGGNVLGEIVDGFEIGFGIGLYVVVKEDVGVVVECV